MTESPSERARIHRHPERGDYDRAGVDAILDEALICHVAIADPEGGAPHLIPTIHVRVGDTLYLHGSRASQTLRALSAGAEVTVAATLVDGIVFARSAFNSSLNYRSVVLYGVAREVTDLAEQFAVTRALADHVAPGRGDDVRLPTDDELRQTLFLALPLTEASAKVRTGPAHDEPEDLVLTMWAGVLPLRTAPGIPEPDEALAPGTATPDYVTNYRRPGPE